MTQEASHKFSVSSPEYHEPKRPTSERRILANRKNALRSTGPKTERGKRAVSRNAIKHGLLAREVVITAGDGEENLEEFNALLERLWESYEPMGVVEESLIQTIATCWWRKARVIRAENGEIRKRLDTLKLDQALRNSDTVNLTLVVSNLELGFFDRENPADKIPSTEQWAAIQGHQTTLRAHRNGLLYLRAVLETAKAEMAKDGFLSDGTRSDIIREFGCWDYLLSLQCSQAGPPASKTEARSSEKIADPQTQQRANTVAVIEDRLERIRKFNGYALRSENLTADAEARRFSFPSSDATDKLIRYEAHLDRQLYRAMDELERQQRRRKGESVPPPLNVNLGRRT
jgi:hypothetical protein